MSQGENTVSLRLAMQHSITGNFSAGDSFLNDARRAISTGTTTSPWQQMLLLATADGLYELGRSQSAAIQRKSWSSANAALLDALAVTIQLYGEASLEVARVLTQLARYAISLGRLIVVHARLREAASTYATLKATDTAEFGMLQYVTGQLRCAEHNFPAALEACNAAAQLWERHLPPFHPLVGDVLNETADCLVVIGGSANLAKAGDLRRRVDKISRRSQTRCSGFGCRRSLQENGEPLDVCDKCSRTYYCSAVCQNADWRAGHKAECPVLAAEGSADDPRGGCPAELNAT